MRKRLTEVINIRNASKPYVYIGRGSMWGNPFIIGRDGTREEVIEKFEQWIKEDEEPRAIAINSMIKELKGKRLGCWCKPLPCHGDILARMADESS